jgi:hypothetical protein
MALRKILCKPHELLDVVGMQQVVVVQKDHVLTGGLVDSDIASSRRALRGLVMDNPDVICKLA